MVKICIYVKPGPVDASILKFEKVLTNPWFNASNFDSEKLLFSYWVKKIENDECKYEIGLFPFGFVFFFS